MEHEAGRRARSLAELNQVQALLFRPEQIGAAIMGFRPDPSDVVIAPFAKCGTTWLQQIFHCLRTRGDMDFDDISRVVPWIETSVGLGLDLTAPQRAHPRGFKSHLDYDRAPKGARYIVALREPEAAMSSFYHFMNGWFLESGAMTPSAFVAERLASWPNGEGYWHHLTSWWGQRENPDVLLLSYEQMTAEPEASIRRVAAFTGIPLDDDLLALTLEQSSRDFMFVHNDRFDDHMMRKAAIEHCGLPVGSGSTKVQKAGAREPLSPEVRAAIADGWTRHVAPATGFPDYAALEAELRRRSRMSTSDISV